MSVEKVLQFIGSKWFVLLLGIGMLLVLPITYSNLMIVFNAGEMSRLWWVPTVFTINLITAIMAIYKAASMFFSKTNEPEDWDDDD